MRLTAAVLAALIAPAFAWGQGSVLQAGPGFSGHAPMYSHTGGQTIIQDSGPASGGQTGLGLSEVLQVNRSPNANTGTGPLGSHDCRYSAPATNSSYYALCFDANAQGGGLISYSQGGFASPAPLDIVAPALNFIINGVTYPFPGTSQTPGGNPTDVQFNLAGAFGGVPGFTFDGTSALSLGVPGTSVGSIGFGNATAGRVTLAPTTGALASSLITIPAVTATMATQNGAVNGQCAAWDVNLILTPVVCGGGGTGSIIDGTTPIISGVPGTLLSNNGGVVGHIATTGSGSVVLSNGGAMVAPILGTPASVNLANGVGLPFATGLTGNILASQMVALPTNDIYLGNGSAQPAASTLSAAIDTVFGSAQGDILYRGASVWTVLVPATAGWALTTQGASANPQWAAVSGGTGCAVVGGAQFNILVNDGASGCENSANASVNVGALSLGTSGTLGSVAMGNATSGTVTLRPVTGALGSVTASLPANTGTISELNLAQTWTAAQTFTNSDLILLGSSTGFTTFSSANAGASNFTITVPGITDTLVTLTATQTLTNKTLTAPIFTSPTLGTPLSGLLTNATGLPISTGLTGAGTGVLTALGNATNGSGGFVTFNGNLGTPTAGVGTNLTGTAAGLTAGLATSANAINSATTTVVVNGATAPTAGQALIATSSTAAHWAAVSGTTGANPTATAGPTAVNGSATTYLRSDGAPAIQVGSASQEGIVQVDGQSIVATAGVISASSADHTFTTGHTMAATDMGGQVNMNGSSLTLTIPAISSTVFAAGMSSVMVNTNSSALTISSTPTINGFSGTSIPQFGGIACTSNGTSLDCVGLGVLANLVTLSGTGQVFTGGVHPTAFSNGTGSGAATITVDVGNGPIQTVTNGGNFTLAMSANDGSIVLRVTNNGSAGTITFSGFSEGTNTGDALTTTNTSKFDISLTRIGGNGHFLISALQ